MKTFRLTKNNSTMQKLSKLFDLAEELGISISFYGHRTIVQDLDRDKDLPTLYLKDIEGEPTLC